MRDKKILILVFLLAFSTLLMGCQTTPVVVDFFGTWVNEDIDTNSITKIEIWRVGETEVYIQIWGACQPTNCDWGEQKTNFDDTLDNFINLIWDHGFAIRSQGLLLLLNGELEVVTFTDFVDPGRLDYESTDYFTKE